MYKDENGKWHHTQIERDRLRESSSGENNGMHGRHRYGEENPFYGKHHTQESINKIAKGPENILYADLPDSPYYLLLAQQNGVCALCGNLPKESRALCIDHDHKTGEIRGLLCDKCNRVLGMFESVYDRFTTYLNESHSGIKFQRFKHRTHACKSNSER